MDENIEEINKTSEEPLQQTTIETPETPKAEQSPVRAMGVLEWLNLMKWRTNPFIFSIVPSLLVGYKAQRERVSRALEEGHKYMLILGPTGSGKTTFLRWLESRLNNFDVIYVGKPPQRADEFIAIFNNKYKRPWYDFWSKSASNIYQLPDFLNKKLKKKHLVIMLDEAHESDTEVLEWLRVLNDQVENMSVILSGLPNFELQLRTNLETFMKRVSAQVELLYLTKEETAELIRRRIQNAGGTGNEFPDEVINSIYNYTGGFPREIIRLCDQLVNNAIIKGTTQIVFDAREKKQGIAEEMAPVSAPLLARMTPMQKEILEMLSKGPMTPGKIANSIDLAKYKSRQHAVRSVNNIVKKLFEDEYLERRKEEKAFVYSLAPRISTLFVRR